MEDHELHRLVQRVQELEEIVIQIQKEFIVLSTATISNLTQFQEDIAKLQTAVTANTAAITQLKSIDAQDAVTIADLQTQIAALKAGQPTLDLSALESSIALLQENNVAAQGVVAPPGPAVAAS